MVYLKKLNYSAKHRKDFKNNMRVYNHSKSNGGHFFKTFFQIILFFLASGNLIALFVFNYNLPGLQKITGPSYAAGTNTTIASPESLETTNKNENFTDTSLTINVPDGILSYNGIGTLDLAEGVTVTDTSGNLVDCDIFTSIKAGASSKNKIIEYSVEDADGNRITAERTLKLGDNYHGPSIEVNGDIPTLTKEELNHITTLLIDSNLLKGDDGFGQDITSSITASVKSTDNLNGSSIVTLNVVNMLNDTVSKDISVSVEIDGPILKLSTNRVTINRGSRFDALRYVEFARDKNGQSLSSRIRVSGSVDTNTPGEYSVEIYATDYDGVKTPVQTLKVTVE